MLTQYKSTCYWLRGKKITHAFSLFVDLRPLMHFRALSKQQQRKKVEILHNYRYLQVQVPPRPLIATKISQLISKDN